MYIERVPNRNSPPAVLLRSSHWDHGKIRKVTHANLSKLPQPLVDAIALLLRGGTVVGPGSLAVRILDWLARRHLQDGCLALYDLTSVWYTGEHCELARHGYSRDGKRGSRQILVGLLCDAAGRRILMNSNADSYPFRTLIPIFFERRFRSFLNSSERSDGAWNHHA